jgi:hypothetical protein
MKKILKKVLGEKIYFKIEAFKKNIFPTAYKNTLIFIHLFCPQIVCVLTLGQM